MFWSNPGISDFLDEREFLKIRVGSMGTSKRLSTGQTTGSSSIPCSKLRDSVLGWRSDHNHTTVYGSGFA